MVTVEQHLGAGAHGGPHVAHVAFHEAARTRHDESADDEDRHQNQESVAEADGVAQRADDREDEEARQHEQRSEGEPDGAHARGNGEGERRQHAWSHDGQREVDAGVADKGQRDVGGQREQHGEAGGHERGHRQHAEDEADVAPGQAGGDDGAHSEAKEIEELDRRNEIGALHGVEVERLLVLQRGQGRETGDGGGQEGEGDEDAAQHADLPHGTPGLPERWWGLDREVDSVRERGVAQGRRLAALGRQHLLAQLELLVAAPRGLAQAQADNDHDHDGHGEEEEGGAPAEDGGQAGAEQDADDGADADPRAVGGVDPGPGRHGVVIGQQRVVRGEDHGLPHGDADQHDGGHHDALGEAEADGERSADERTDERDAHAVGAVGQDGDGERAGQRGGAGDGDDQEDAGVGEMEGVADVRREHVEGALGGLVEQLYRRRAPRGGRARRPPPSLARRLTGPAPLRQELVLPGGVARWRRASRSRAQSRRS